MSLSLMAVEPRCCGAAGRGSGINKRSTSTFTGGHVELLRARSSDLHGIKTSTPEIGFCRICFSELDRKARISVPDCLRLLRGNPCSQCRQRLRLYPPGWNKEESGEFAPSEFRMRKRLDTVETEFVPVTIGPSSCTTLSPACRASSARIYSRVVIKYQGR